MGRSPCCDKTQVKRGPWSPQEDETLKNYLQKHGTAGGNWITLPQRAGLKRCGKSCRLRWLNYLRPDIKHGGFTMEEDDIICTLYSKMGSRWSIIASHLPGRTDNDVKNHWNTKLKKKLMAMAATTATTSHKDNNNAANNTAFQIYDPKFSALLTQSTPPTIMPFLGDDHHNIGFPEGTSKFGSISKFLHSDSEPQEDSSISESSSFAKNDNFVTTWSDNGSKIEGLPLMMDVGTAHSYEILTTGIWPQESTFLEAIPSSQANLFGLFYY